MLSSIGFNDKLSLVNFPELDFAYKQAKQYFEQLNTKISVDDVKKKFPAYCEFNQFIQIKFPTYKIRIVNCKYSANELGKLLYGAGNYYICEECNVVSLPSLRPVQSTAVICLEANGLDENIRTADKIENILREQNIYTQKCVDYGVFPIPIIVDEDGYITVIKQ